MIRVLVAVLLLVVAVLFPTRTPVCLPVTDTLMTRIFDVFTVVDLHVRVRYACGKRALSPNDMRVPYAHVMRPLSGQNENNAIRSKISP